MRKIKLFLCVALFGAIGYGAFSAYDYYTMSEEEKFTLANIEALTDPEDGLATECYDKYEAYSGGSLQRFRPCDTPKCEHIWAYSPRKKTVCPK